jgi:hypothetical protein
MPDDGGHRASGGRQAIDRDRRRFAHHAKSVVLQWLGTTLNMVTAVGDRQALLKKKAMSSVARSRSACAAIALARCGHLCAANT